jgi:hypothetical protein
MVVMVLCAPPEGSEIVKKLFRNPFRAHVEEVAETEELKSQERAVEKKTQEAAVEESDKVRRNQEDSATSLFTSQLVPILQDFIGSLDVGAPIIKVGSYPGSITFSASAANDDRFIFSVSVLHKYDPESLRWNLSRIDVKEGSLYRSLDKVFSQESAKIKHLLILLSEIAQAIPEVPVELALERVNTLVLKAEMEKFTHPGVTLRHDTLVQFFSVEGHVSYDIVIATTSASED